MASIALMFGLLLALLVALLAVPLTVVFSIHRTEESRGFVRFSWLFGLVRFQFRMPRPARAGPRPASASKKKGTRSARRGRKRKGAAAGVVSLVREKAIRKRVYRFIGDVLRATHARDLMLRLRIGLGDPADTGRLWAAVGPVAGMAQNLRGVAVRIEPEFMDPVFEVESHGRFRLVPLQFIVIAAVFALSPTMLRAWRQLCRGTD